MKKLYPHQATALSKLQNGSILVGGTGSGKTLVGLAYYYTKIVGGSIDPPAVPTKSVDLYVITTARKRDELDWNREAAEFGICREQGVGVPVGKFIVDSWNKVKSYIKVTNAFFIFDEQRSIGRGVWARSMIKIAKRNRWIMLSATPADRWKDLATVFIANGFYRNYGHFEHEHILYAPYVKYPKIKRYLNIEKLKEHRNRVYVVMPFKKHTKQHVLDVRVKHDQMAIDELVQKEWNPFKDRPIRSLPEHNFTVRRLVNQDPSRIEALKEIFETAKRVIVFYNFNFELKLIKSSFPEHVISEYNSKKHDPVPSGDCWLYLIQYMSGNEAWECTTTNHMVFYSLNYSYRTITQSMGRIDRLNTEYVDLYYYRFVSESSVDKSILRAFAQQKSFNERGLRFT
jgi:hypothetical protein